MVDVVAASVRSRMMAGIGGANTLPEMHLRKMLHAAGFRYRLHAPELPGRPDLLLPRHKAAIFVHGCFWHRHAGCHWCTQPATNAVFWERKFASNVNRDRMNVETLLAHDWRVATIWECSLRGQTAELTLEDLVSWLVGDSPRFETRLVRKRAPPA